MKEKNQLQMKHREEFPCIPLTGEKEKKSPSLDLVCVHLCCVLSCKR